MEKIRLNPDVVAAVAAVPMTPCEGTGPDGPHVAHYFGPHAGIRCRLCNLSIEPDPAVTRTAASPSPNTAATLAAVSARGERCARCGHWTFAALLTGVGAGRPTLAGLCRNCLGLRRYSGSGMSGAQMADAIRSTRNLTPEQAEQYAAANTPLLRRIQRAVGMGEPGGDLLGTPPTGGRVTARRIEGPYLRPRHDRGYSR